MHVHRILTSALTPAAVDAPLEITFNEISEELDGGSVLSLDIFKEILDEVCGPESQPIRDWRRQAGAKEKVKLQPLDICKLLPIHVFPTLILSHVFRIRRRRSL